MTTTRPARHASLAHLETLAYYLIAALSWAIILYYALGAAINGR